MLASDRAWAKVRVWILGQVLGISRARELTTASQLSMLRCATRQLFAPPRNAVNNAYHSSLRVCPHEHYA